MALRYTALAGFGPDQAPPRQPPLDGGALEHQVTHCWAPLVALRYATLAGFGPDQASPQHAPLVGAALVARARNGHQQALGWATLVTPVTPATAPLVAAGGSEVPGGIGASQTSHWQGKCQQEHPGLVSN